MSSDTNKLDKSHTHQSPQVASLVEPPWLEVQQLLPVAQLSWLVAPLELLPPLVQLSPLVVQDQLLPEVHQDQLLHQHQVPDQLSLEVS